MNRQLRRCGLFVLWREKSPYVSDQTNPNSNRFQTSLSVHHLNQHSAPYHAYHNIIIYNNQRRYEEVIITNELYLKILCLPARLEMGRFMQECIITKNIFKNMII